MMRPGRLLVLALAALAAWSVWWLRQLQTTTSLGHAAPTHRIDYTMDKFELTAMDPVGKPQLRLQAGTMTHFADDDSSEFLQPRVEYIAQEHTPLHFIAERGWMASQGNEIRLLGAVRIEGSDPHPFTLISRDIQFKPDQSLVTTAAAVELKAPGLHVTAVGMRIYVDQQRVQFLSQVQGHYDDVAH